MITDWCDVYLNECLILGNGKARPLSHGDIPVYGGNGIFDYCNSYNYLDGTIIIGRVGAYCGSVFISFDKIWISDNALSAKPVNDNDIKFMYYYLLNIGLNQFAEGSSHPLLTHSLLYSLKISLPPAPEQRAIAAVLSNLDDKIDLLQRQNATLEAMAEALFKECFVKNGKEEWKQGYLPDEFEFTMGQSPSGDSFNEVGLGVPMFQGNADFGFRFPSKRVYTTAPTRFAQPFDTLISVRAPVGAQNMAQEKCCIGRGLSAFRYKKNPLFYSYTYFKLRHLLKEILIYNDEGTVFGSISKQDFNTLALVIPDYASVADYEKRSAPLNNKIISNCEQIRTLEKLRDTLLPKLMSGEVRVAH